MKELSEFYFPDKILYRDKEIEEIKEVFDRFLNFGSAKNILIRGFSGSGKTLSINTILNLQNNRYVYISGAQQITAHQVLKAITDLTYNTREKLMSEAIIMLRQNPKVIIIDEINKLKRSQEIKWLFNDLNTIFRETGCPIILITNQRDLLKIPDEDALKTLFFRIVDFNPYNAEEIKGILEQRIKIINKNHKEKINIPEYFLPFISAISVKESEGSARLALKLTQEAILKKDFSQDFIYKILKELNEGEWSEFLKSLPLTERRFLFLLLTICPLYNNEIPISELTRRIKEYPPQRISQLINSLDSYGVIERRKSGKDKRSAIIKFISEEIYEKLYNHMGEVSPIL